MKSSTLANSEFLLQSAAHRILIVDDNPTNLKVLAEAIREQGWTALVATDGESALEQIAYMSPDLILLDVMMPGMDGFETCHQIKTQDKTQEDIPIIFMTALADIEDKVKGFEVGAVDYITKPIQHQEAIARIRVHLQLRHLNQTLEEQVDARTTELQNALTTLKQTQLQLVQNEKMSSLGQLVAGVAHEINNPINFIHGNISPAKEYIQDLLKLIDCYQTYIKLPPQPVQECIEEIDLDFLRTDLPQLVSSMKFGTDRIRNIVLSLRNFSRMDEAAYKPVTLSEGIDSTLLILRHRFKQTAGYPAIQVKKDYGPLPEVECYPSQLNQVFLNLISNSIDALEEWLLEESVRESNFTPKISIQTRLLENNWVTIHISDNGPGISENLRSRIFDAFFTTKDIGKGTGLGLSICHQIVVDKHHGSLNCYSEPGQGTEFVVKIPIKITNQVKETDQA
ncbi:MAG: response regulator [Leptolyngbya sp. SIO3F4]|nr:response regulator [Leptolyngbya sp. SIO3F4]